MIHYADPWASVMHGDAREVLKELPEHSVDMTLCSPPYYSLRKYHSDGVVWDGDPVCEHEWGAELAEHHPGQVEQTKWKNAEAAGHGQTAKSGNFCLKCGAWRGQLGSEPDPDLFIRHLCDIFDLVRRVMKPTGTLWCNLGDSYAGSWLNMSHAPGKDYPEGRPPQSYNIGVPAKSLIGIPERFVLEMLRRGWIRRQTIVWHKPSCMPSSAKDRFTTDFEYVYCFAVNNKTAWWVNEQTRQMVGKQPKGIHGIEGIDWHWIECPKCRAETEEMEPPDEPIELLGGAPVPVIRELVINPGCRKCKGSGQVKESYWTGYDYYFEQQFEPMATNGKGGFSNKKTSKWSQAGLSSDVNAVVNPLGRNKRAVWSLTSKGQSEEHYAAYPEALCETPIKAGCPEFICQRCGKPRVKIYKTEPMKIRRTDWGEHAGNRTASSGTMEEPNHIEFIGYSDCGCGATYESGVVLDPFSGTGTSGIVAKKLNRRSILIDNSLKYVQIAARRLKKLAGVQGGMIE